ncbi:hypothetical protein B9W68_30570 [Streptomyces sp. CS227]|uniref:hypothetical protein n=1 Tax=Streptomyces sp. CS227 TaxID=1982763 RepID=UPI000B6983BF|nr:hypothetical protein [Streptomyces sp. CS227]OWA00006.1 hypothetical protein B9W68_30570 [Streptomyces sp. CS227]
MNKHKVAQLATLVAAIGFTYSTALHLATADVGFAVTFACSTAVFTAFLNTGLDLAAKVSTSSFRCPHCTFAVRVQNAAAGETRRWQEIAADHPRHLTDSRA